MAILGLVLDEDLEAGATIVLISMVYETLMGSETPGYLSNRGGSQVRPCRNPS